MATLLGGASRQTCASTFPPDSYYCLLDELPLHLVPRRNHRLLQLPDAEPLYLNPDCVILPATECPNDFAPFPDLLAGFAKQGTVAWVRDAVSGSQLPFWLGPKLETIVRKLRRNEEAAPSIPQDARALLAGAGILISESRNRAQQIADAMTLEKAAALFADKGYAPLVGLIHPFHVAALRRYYRYLIRSGAIQLGDRQSPRRYVAYNEAIARFFHFQIASILSTIACERLKPSYVYMASYLSGAELRKHTDRPQCEFSITFCLDFSPEPALETPWPINLDTNGGTVTVYQALGDGLAYRGTRLPHYRSPLGEGQTSTSIFFHYVSHDFEGSLG